MPAAAAVQLLLVNFTIRKSELLQVAKDRPLIGLGSPGFLLLACLPKGPRTQEMVVDCILVIKTIKVKQSFQTRPDQEN